MPPRRAVPAITGLVGLVLLGVASTQPLPASAPPAAADPVPRADSGTLPGLCEASTIAPWPGGAEDGGFVVGDNEAETVLFRFSADMTPLGTVALDAPVEDIEAVTHLPDGLLVVGSQGANKKGRPKPLREQVLVLGQAPVRPDLSACGPCEAARGIPPKEGGLSVEGAAWWQGALWLGLRSPLVDGDALLLRMEGDATTALSVAEVLPVSLDGLGVRELVVHEDALVVLAGPPGRGDTAHAIFRLDAPGQAPVRSAVTLPPSSEGIVPLDDGGFLFVTDGDGAPGEPCKAPATWGRTDRPG